MSIISTYNALKNNPGARGPFTRLLIRVLLYAAMFLAFWIIVSFEIDMNILDIPSCMLIAYGTYEIVRFCKELNGRPWRFSAKPLFIISAVIMVVTVVFSGARVSEIQKAEKEHASSIFEAYGWHEYEYASEDEIEYKNDEKDSINIYLTYTNFELGRRRADIMLHSFTREDADMIDALTGISEIHDFEDEIIAAVASADCDYRESGDDVMVSVFESSSSGEPVVSIDVYNQLYSADDSHVVRLVFGTIFAAAVLSLIVNKILCRRGRDFGKNSSK